MPGILLKAIQCFSSYDSIGAGHSSTHHQNGAWQLEAVTQPRAAEEERVADCQAPSTPLFPREREGEFCSFLRHSVRTFAEGVAGPARICNVGAGFWDTRVAPRGRGGQGDGAGSLSRVFAAAHPCQTAHGRFTNRPYRGAGGGARGSVPRVGEGSTAVRIFQEGWRKCGIGADWWGEMAQT